MKNLRHYNFTDRVLMQVDAFLSATVAHEPSSRLNPAAKTPESELSSTERRHSAGLMRVNHTGEVCAQALYQSQLSVARDAATQAMLEKASVEEMDHLAWTHQRLHELNSHRSYLNGFWYLNSFLIGTLAGFAGDAWSLGFVEETERQVTKHLDGHLEKLSEKDSKSRRIVAQMREDEIQHGEAASAAGAQELPMPIKRLMALQARVMTTLAYWI